jgi:hypothetical protein
VQQTSSRRQVSAATLSDIGAVRVNDVVREIVIAGGGTGG